MVNHGTTSPMKAISVPKQPLYVTVMAHIQAQISAGVYKPLRAIPSEWDLAAELGVSQGTVRKAMNDLVSQGVLYRQQGVGTFVHGVMSEWGRLALRAYGANHRSDAQPAQEILSVNKTHALDLIAEGLSLKRSQPVWRIVSLWRIGAQVVALDEAYLPFDGLEHLSLRHLLECAGLYACLQHIHGLRLQVKEEVFLTSTINKEEASLLKKEPNAVMLTVVRKSETLQKRPIEWRKRTVLTDFYSLHLISEPD